MRLFWGCCFSSSQFAKPWGQRKVNTFVAKMHQETAGVHSKLSFTPVFGASTLFPSIQIDSSGAASVTPTFICRTHGNGGRGFFVGLFLYFCVSLAPSLCRCLPKLLDCSAGEGKKNTSLWQTRHCMWEAAHWSNVPSAFRPLLSSSCYEEPVRVADIFHWLWKKLNYFVNARFHGRQQGLEANVKSVYQWNSWREDMRKCKSPGRFKQMYTNKILEGYKMDIDRNL